MYEGHVGPYRGIYLPSKKGHRSLIMGPTIIYVPSAGRSFRHSLAEDVAKRPVRPRRRFFRR